MFPLRSRQVWLGTFLVALSGMLYGFIGYFGTKIQQNHCSLTTMLFWRFCVAALWVGVWTLFSPKKPPRISPNVLMKIVAFGAIVYSAGSGFYFEASHYIGTGLGMVIFFSYPVFIALFAWILKGWQLNIIALLSLLAVVAGLFLLKGSGEDGMNMIGISYGLLAAFCYAIYVFKSKDYAGLVDSKVLTFFICTANGLIFFLLAQETHSFVVPSDKQTWIFIIALGILATALPIQLLLDGLKYVSPLKASIISVLEPVVTVLVGIALLDERLSLIQLTGMLVVLLGAILIQFERTAHIMDEIDYDAKPSFYTD